MFRTNAERGAIAVKKEVYGVSESGVPLYYFPSAKKCSHLIIAGIHGEEPETTFLLSRTLRFFYDSLDHVAFILCANPDGMALGTRGNQRGVDLNRNFPTSNWNKEDVYSRLTLESPRETLLSPGNEPLSEKETIALVSIIKELQPSSILSMHSPMACIDTPFRTKDVVSLEKIFQIPWVSSIGYETPGSLGTWCIENNMECITLELPRIALEAMETNYAVSFAHWISSR